MDWIFFDRDDGESHRVMLARQFKEDLFPLLRGVALEVTNYAFTRSGYPTTITCVTRTPEENRAVGGYKFSGHLMRPEDFVYSFDQRTKDMDEALRKAIIKRYEMSSPMVYVIYHNNHLHVGVRRRYHRKEFPRAKVL